MTPDEISEQITSFTPEGIFESAEIGIQYVSAFRATDVTIHHRRTGVSARRRIEDENVASLTPDMVNEIIESILEDLRPAILQAELLRDRAELSELVEELRAETGFRMSSAALPEIDLSDIPLVPQRDVYRFAGYDAPRLFGIEPGDIIFDQLGRPIGVVRSTEMRMDNPALSGFGVSATIEVDIDQQVGLARAAAAREVEVPIATGFVSRYTENEIYDPTIPSFLTERRVVPIRAEEPPAESRSEEIADSVPQEPFSIAEFFE